jgi:phosphatidylinositol-3-phosphatase
MNRSLFERVCKLRSRSLASALCVLFGMFAAANTADGGSPLEHVIVIVMENTNAEPHGDAPFIYGNMKDAPFINNELLPRYARALNFRDKLPLGVPSEPHYVLMEAGTNAFSDFTFGDETLADGDPSAARSTASAAHLVSQMRATGGRVTWMSYQEGMDEETGACPINSSRKTHYGAKHDPFVFFQDVSGNPPSKTNEYCAKHHRPYSSLAADLAADRLASYVFITPNLCHDMHDKCGNNSRVRNGDDWLRAELPAMITYADVHKGLIFIAWDEGHETRKIPFLAIGPHVKKGFAGAALYDHGSIIKTVEKIFGLPVLETVKGSRDLGDLMEGGALE